MLDTAVYFSVVNRNEGKITVTSIFLEHLTDSIWMKTGPGVSNEYLPMRFYLGKVTVDYKNRRTQINDLNYTIPIERDSTMSFSFDYQRFKEYNNRPTVDWRRSKLVVELNGINFEKKIKLIQPLDSY